MDKAQSILIVDDNHENIKVLSKLLKKEDYRIRIAINGLQAIKSVETEPADLILMDIQMPEMDGYEACRRIKASKENKSIPIIFISAMTETFNKVQAFNAGGADYISKPFQFEEVLARVKTHLKLRKQTIDLEMTLKKLSDTQVQLVQSEKMASLGQLTAGVAHEINNPINFVILGSEGLKKDVIALTKILKAYSKSDPNVETLKKELEYDYLIENIPRTIEDIQVGGRRTAEIVQSLRVFSRVDEYEKKFADIHENLDSTLMLRSGELGKGIELMKNYDKSITEIECFPSQLNQVFLQIINNAIEFMGEEGTLTITTKNSSDHITIGIKDTGPGIPNDIQKKVFDPFFTTKDVGKGTGLGLAISFGIIKKHGGTIEVKSEEGVGTEFVITLPKSFS